MWQVYGLGLKAEKPNRIFKNWQVMTDLEFDSLPYSVYYGMDFGLSAPTTLVAMKFDGDETFFFKELLYKPMNQMSGTLSDELHNLGIDKKLELICDSSNEINKTEGQKLRNSGYNIIFALKGKGSVVSGIELLQKKKVCYTSSSTNLEQEYENHSWRVVQGVQLDEPEQGNDHALDGCKYVASWYARINYLT
jgi:phage terminase large subunit